MRHMILRFGLLAAACLKLACAPQAMAGGIVFAEKDANGDLTVTTLDDGLEGVPYESGSIGKYVCTLTILQLENQGKLSLDQTIKELLPRYRGERGSVVTLRELLANRAGLKEGVVEQLLSDPKLARTSMPAARAANRFATEPSADEPGSRFDYVNSSWIIVQAILERAAEMPLQEAVESYVFRPARTEKASIFVGTLSGEEASQDNGPYLPLPDFMSCAGALAATPQDLIAISALPFSSSRFDDEDRQELMTVTTEDQDYTLGGRFETVTDAAGVSRRISWQSGNNGLSSAQVIYDHVQDVAFAVVVSDADIGIVLERRQAWLAQHGLVWDEAQP